MSEKPPDEALAAFHNAINQILDLADSYRAAAVARGYSPTAAEQMATEFNAALMRHYFQAKP